MFCKYCGKPIDEGTMRCRICGRPVGPLEGGNGFWDLLEGKKEEPEKTEEVPARTDPALAEEMKSLREEVEKLRRERKMHPAGKSAAPAVMAALLGLLAMALGVFVLYQMRAADARMQSLERRLEESQTRILAIEQAAAGQEQSQAEEQSAAAGDRKWHGIGDLTGIPLQPSQQLFEGPNKGDNDNRGQSIRLGYPEYFEETPIFTARFLGQPGTYRYYWVRVETDENTKEVFFTPLTEEEGYIFRNPTAGDQDKIYRLSIGGEVKEEHLGHYAFIVVDTQTRFGYVSQIVELYDRAEQVLAPAEESGQSGGGNAAEETGDGNGS